METALKLTPINESKKGTKALLAEKSWRIRDGTTPKSF